jgi:LPS sulfotransferase NodH
MPFRSFVILAAMRTGSNLLEESLKALPGVTVHGEAFNPAFLAWPNRESHLGLTQAERDADPMELLRRIRDGAGLNGFRYFPGHDARVFGAILADRACAKIVLSRNPVESYVSLKIARETGQWRLTDNRRRRDGKATFDAGEFAAYHDELDAFHRRILHALQVSGQTAFHLRYEDLTDPEILTGLARFLGVDAGKVAPAKSLVPQNPGPLAEKVTNPADMSAALARLDPFGLNRLPVFEPRRGPSVPGFVAAKEAPLLFMPVKSGPCERVIRWFDGFGGGESGFTQAMLRDWMRARAPHRRFTVLRHPLPRAWAAFRSVLLAEAQTGLSEPLARTLGVSLPVLGPEAVRAAFAGFLTFLRSNLRGQTALRVEPIWASQQAILQGFADFAPPDAVLREERLTEGLAGLCDELGLSPPLLPPDEDWSDLRAIHDDEIEALARAACQRDYVAFGFGRWA